MAKDPAVLFYFDHWRGGTITMTRHLKGCYIDLLDAQFNNGHLSLEEIKTVLGTDFAVWGSLSKKFAVDEAGKYFNERLDLEINKRKEFSVKQSERIKKRWSKSGNTAVLPKIVNINVDINKNLNQKGGAGEKEILYSNAEKEISGNRIQFEKICMISGTEEATAKTELHSYHLWLAKNSRYPISIPAMLAGFESWLLTAKRFQNELNKKNGSSTNNAGHSKKNGQAAAIANLIKTGEDEFAALRAEDP